MPGLSLLVGACDWRADAFAIESAWMANWIESRRSLTKFCWMYIRFCIATMANRLLRCLDVRFQVNDSHRGQRRGNGL